MTPRPKTLRYREAPDAAEQSIVDALPEIVGTLIAVAGRRAVASLLGVEDGTAENSTETTRTERGDGLTLHEDKPFRPPSEMLAALIERYSNIAIGKILDVSEAAVRMMLKRAGLTRANRVFSSLDDWQAVIVRAELKAELARRDKAKVRVTTG